MRSYSNITDPSVAKALAHPLRTKILSLLEQRTASPSEIADELGVPLTNVSYHVRHLHRLGVIKLVRRSVRRGAVQHYYQADVRPRVTDQAWSQLPEVVRQSAIGSTLQQVAEEVTASAIAGGFSRDDANLSRVPLRLDAEGWQAAARALEDVRARLGEIEQESAARVKRGAADHDDGTVVLMLFESAQVEAPEPEGHRRTRARGRAASKG